MTTEQQKPNESLTVNLAELLAAKKKLSTPQRIDTENQMIAGLRSSFGAEKGILGVEIERLVSQSKSLEEQESQQIEEVQREKKLADKELIDGLRKMICIGNSDYTYTPDHTPSYVGELDFGFEEEDAVKLLEIALENKIDVGEFLEFCEYLRGSLEYSRKNKYYSRDILRQERVLYFSPVDFGLDDVMGPLNRGIDVLFLLFVKRNYHREDFIKAREFFGEAKGSWEKIDDSRIEKKKSQAFSCFLNLLIDNDEFIEFFRSPTFENFYYGYRGD